MQQYRFNSNIFDECLFLQDGGKKDIISGFYFAHGTHDKKSMFSILKDGIIYRGTKTKTKHFSGYPIPYVFATIYFDDILNIDYYQPYSLILNPKIISKYKIKFSKGWSGGRGVGGINGFGEDIDINKNDKHIEEKIKEIRKYVKNPKKTIGESKIEVPKMMNHEVIFHDDIVLDDDVLMGIIFMGMTDRDMKKIKKLIKGKPYEHVKIFTDNGLISYKDLV
jgi:hypothetical protein